MSLDELLKRDCIIDTSLLSNFVFTGYAHLLQKLVDRPVLISPAVLDPSETLLPFICTVAPRCEFLKPLHEIHGDTSETYSAAAPFIQSFALASGSLWQPIELTEEELALARRFSLREIWKETRNVDPRFTKRGLGAGESEACAVAVKRNKLIKSLPSGAGPTSSPRFRQHRISTVGVGSSPPQRALDRVRIG